MGARNSYRLGIRIPFYSTAGWEFNCLLEQGKVQEMMTREVVTVTPETPVAEAARIIHDLKIGGFPVVDQDRLVGIITEVDLLGAFIEIMGITSPSTRIDVVLGDGPKGFETISKVVQDHGGEIIFVGISSTDDVQDEKVDFFRLEPCDPTPITAALKEAGDEVRFAVQAP